MNQSPRELGSLRRGERIGGLIYLPMFLIGTEYLALLIVLLFRPNLSEDELLVPVNRCSIHVVGTRVKSMADAVSEAVETLRSILS